jgi:O-antigen/teichoic acid export membrane protein
MLRSILCNSFFSLISDVANRLSSALLLILIARASGDAAAGVFTLGTNYTLILQAIALWGLDQLLIRDVARKHDLSGQHFGHFFIIRATISLALWTLLATLILGFRPYLSATNVFIALVGGTLVGDSLSNLAHSLFVAFERVWVSAITFVCFGVLRLGVGAWLLSSNVELWALSLVLVTASWAQAAVLTWLAYKHLAPVPFRFNAEFCRRQLVAGFPFVPITLLIAVEAQLGGILLSLFHSEEMVGAYGMANVVISALALISQAIRIGVFPVMSRLYQTERARFVQLYERSWRYLSIVSLPLVILVILLSDQIIRLIYQRDAPQAIATLQWLAPVLLFYFLNIPNARLMIIGKRQRVLAWFFGISAGVNVAMCFLLIPGYGSQAAALSRVISMGILFSLNYVYVYRRGLASSGWRLVWKPLAASLMMALVVFRIFPRHPDYVRGLIGIALYGALIVFFKAIPSAEWQWLRQRLFSLPKRQRR